MWGEVVEVRLRLGVLGEVGEVGEVGDGRDERRRGGVEGRCGRRERRQVGGAEGELGRRAEGRRLGLGRRRHVRCVEQVVHGGWVVHFGAVRWCGAVRCG